MAPIKASSPQYHCRIFQNQIGVVEFLLHVDHESIYQQSKMGAALSDAIAERYVEALRFLLLLNASLNYRHQFMWQY